MGMLAGHFIKPIIDLYYPTIFWAFFCTFVNINFVLFILIIPEFHINIP